MKSRALAQPFALPNRPKLAGNKRYLVTYLNDDGEFCVVTIMANNFVHAMQQFISMAANIAKNLKTTPNYELYSITRAS